MLFDPNWQKATTAREALLRAADLIERRGHAKKELQNEQGGLCLVGALNVAIFGTHSHMGATEEHEKRATFSHALLAASTHLGLRGGGDLVPWNNHPDRAPQEVIDALRASAENIKEVADAV